MAVQTSLIRFKGKFNGSRGYKKVYDKKNISFIGKPGGPTKYDVHNLPSCINILNNAQEFGGCIQQSIQINQHFVLPFDLIGGFFYRRLTSIFSNIIKLGTGVPGQRVFDLYTNMNYINNFRIGKIQFTDIFRSLFHFTFVPARNDISCHFSLFDPSAMKYPIGTTHFRLMSLGFCKSNSSWDSISQKYVLVDPINDFAINMGDSTAYLPINVPIGYIISLNASNPLVTMTTDLTFIFVLCIKFYKLINGIYYKINSINASSIVFVG